MSLQCDNLSGELQDQWSSSIWYVAMANGPLHKLCHSCPWGQIWPRPGGSIVSIDLLWEKNLKIFFSETTGPTALIFGMWQWLMVLYINCASHAPGVKFGHAPGVDSLHRLTIGKTKKIFFSETPRPTALRSSNGPLHKLCHSCPWGQIWPGPGG